MLNEVDEEIHQNATWRSPSGGTWKFESDVLSVTWQMKSQNIYFEGEKSEEMSKRIISLINQYKNASMNTSFNQGKVSDAEPARSRVAEQTLDKHGLFYPQLHKAAECKKTSSENGDVMIDESADINSSNENNEKNAVPQVTFNKRRLPTVWFSYNRIYIDQTLPARITRGMFVGSYKIVQSF